MNFNIKMEDIREMMKNDNVTSKDFAEIAMEESAELIQATTKIKRGRCTLTDKDNLIEEMADNILATMYLMESLGLTDEVSEKIEQKHSRNYKNAENQRFIRREKCKSLENTSKLLFNSIKLSKGSKPIIATALDENYAIVVELHLSYNLIYVQKYDSHSCEPELEDMLVDVPMFTETFFMEYNFEDEFKKIVQIVYNKYKQSILL